MALFFSRAVLGRICMLCLLVFAGCQPVELSRGCIHCFPPCMQQRVGQLQIDLTHTDQLLEILTQITPCMQAALPYVLAACAAAGRRSRQGRQGAAQPPAAHRRRFSAPLVGALFGDGLRRYGPFFYSSYECSGRERGFTIMLVDSQSCSNIAIVLVPSIVLVPRTIRT